MLKNAVEIIGIFFKSGLLRFFVFGNNDFNFAVFNGVNEFFAVNALFFKSVFDLVGA